MIERHPGFDPYRHLDRNLSYGDRLNRWILLRPRQRIVQLLKGQRVLDVCCGTGNLTAMLVAAGCQAIGVDSSPTMLSHARQKQIPAEFKLMDATQLPFQHAFDAAVITIALHEMPPQVREQVWESMRRAVLPGGRLIALDFAVPRRNNPMARMASALAERDERAFRNIDPPHYENYREFMQGGGLLSWIQKRGRRLEAEYHFWGGTVAVVVVRQSMPDEDAGSMRTPEGIEVPRSAIPAELAPAKAGGGNPARNGWTPVPARARTDSSRV